MGKLGEILKLPSCKYEAEAVEKLLQTSYNFFEKLHIPTDCPNEENKKIIWRMFGKIKEKISVLYN